MVLYLGSLRRKNRITKFQWTTPRKSYFLSVSPEKHTANHMMSTLISQLKYAWNFANLAISSYSNISSFILSLDRICVALVLETISSLAPLENSNPDKSVSITHFFCGSSISQLKNVGTNLHCTNIKKVNDFQVLSSILEQKVDPWFFPPKSSLGSPGHRLKLWTRWRVLLFLPKHQKGGNTCYSSGFKEELNVSSMYIPSKTAHFFHGRKLNFFPFFFFPIPFFLFELMNVFISCALPVVEQKGSKLPDLRNLLLFCLHEHF